MRNGLPAGHCVKVMPVELATVPFAPRYGVAMRVGLRVAKVSIDAIDQAVADGVFHVFGLFVNLVPREFEGLRQEQFDQAMSPQDTQRQPLAAGSEAHAFVSFVLDELRVSQRLEHRGDTSR